MADGAEQHANRPQSVAEAAVRALRHEVGDLLQTVYATAALLQHRLPAGCDLERRILADMRARGEACRTLLDLAHDLVCPMSLTCESIHWEDILGPMIAAAAERHPAVRIEAAWEAAPSVFADAQRMEQTCRLVLEDVCGAAATRVDVALSPTTNGNEVQWTVVRDGPALPAEERESYFRLGRTGMDGPSGIGMALVQQIVQLHGGRIAVDSPGKDGLRITVCLPAFAEDRN
jgi:signal transduction histidine kinase